MKIFHISDLHFGMHQEEIVNYFLSDIAEMTPDIILISGDITQRATDLQYEMFVSFLKKVKLPVLIVPGNHDIPLHNVFSRFFYPFAQYKRYVNPKLSVHFENNEVRILGVNSVNPYRIKDGTLSKEVLTKINRYFEPAFTGLNILFFHHNFDYLEGWHKPLENYQEFLTYLKDSPINIVCTGHSHYAHVSIIEKNNSNPCILIHAGSLLCTRRKDGLNSYYMIETLENSCKIDWRVFKDNKFIHRLTEKFRLRLLETF